TLGGEATDIVVMRIMCRRGFEMDFAELLLEDYKALMNPLMIFIKIIKLR
ncbi:hypothetical protein, partial [Escherichia coli]